MHECGVVYRDLKLENILLTSDGHIVFSDLGMSRYLQEGERTYSFVGTPQYMVHTFFFIHSSHLRLSIDKDIHIQLISSH